MRQSGDGWQIISLYPPPQIRLTGDELSGFAGIEISPETETIEIYHHDGNTQTLTTQDLDQAGDTTRQHLALPTPVPPDRAGTFLIVGRNHDGQATLVTGIAVGRQTRLTVAIDALIANGTPADPTPLKEALATNPATELDMNAATLLTDLSPDLDLDLYIIPFADRSGVSFYVLDPSGSIAGGGSDSVYFNENGYISYTFNQSEDDGYTIAITPDTIGIDPDIGGTIHPSGHIAILAGNHFAELIVDGDTLRKAN
ncbi:MAG: hypothetical protein WBM50_03640 [Acidimicrobiales bacterium]